MIYVTIHVLVVAVRLTAASGLRFSSSLTAAAVASDAREASQEALSEGLRLFLLLRLP
jgi:hypothetical protein